MASCISSFERMSPFGVLNEPSAYTMPWYVWCLIGLLMVERLRVETSVYDVDEQKPTEGRNQEVCN